MLKKSIIPILGVILAGHASAAVTVQTSSMTSVGTSYVNITVAQFDTTLGTLTGVKVSVAANANGSVSLKNNAVAGGNVTVTDISSTLSVRNPSATNLLSGYGPIKSSTISELKTTADWNDASLAPQETEIFTINAGQSFTIGDVNIAASFFSYYQGTGSVTFQAKAPTTATISGAQLASDASLAGANVQYSIEYTYTPPVSPVPETSSVIFTGLLLGSGLTVRRRKVLA